MKTTPGGRLSDIEEDMERDASTLAGASSASKAKEHTTVM